MTQREFRVVVYTELNVEYVVFYKVNFKLFNSIDIGNIQKTLNKITEQHFQDVAQKVQCNKKLDSFAAHFDRYLTNNKSTTIFHNNLFWYTLYGKLYWFNEIPVY